jgi:hypothetical protein
LVVAAFSAINQGVKLFNYFKLLLIKFMRFKAASVWSLSNLVAFLRWNLFTYRNLWDWLDRLDDTPALEPLPSRQPLPFRGLGQQ